MSSYEEYLQHIREFFDQKDAGTAALLATIAEAENSTSVLEAELERLRARVAELEADPEPELVYSTDFTSNNGEWKASTINKAHDNARALPRNVRFTPEGLFVDIKAEMTTHNGDVRQWTSGEIQGRSIVVGNYFEGELVALSPSVRGVRPCPLWFRPANGSDGEWDIMENMGGQNYAMATVHSEYDNRKMIQQTLRWPGQGDATYVYRFRKSPGRMQVWVDEQLLFDAGPNSPRGVTNNFPWDRIFENPERTWYPRISAEVGCGPRANCTTGFPSPEFTSASMHVTSLKIWNLEESR